MSNIDDPDHIETFLKPTLIKFIVGEHENGAPEHYIHCNARTQFDTFKQEWILIGGGCTGRGKTIKIAALRWLMKKERMLEPKKSKSSWRANFYDSLSDETRSLVVLAKSEDEAEEAAEFEANDRCWPKEFKLADVVQI